MRRSQYLEARNKNKVRVKCLVSLPILFIRDATTVHQVL